MCLARPNYIRNPVCVCTRIKQRGVGWNFHGGCCWLAGWFLECTQESSVERRFSRIVYARNIRCVVHASLFFRISRTLTRGGVAWRKGVFFFFSFLFSNACVLVDRNACAACDHVGGWTMIHEGKRGSGSCGCTYLLYQRRVYV